MKHEFSNFFLYFYVIFCTNEIFQKKRTTIFATTVQLTASQQMVYFAYKLHGDFNYPGDRIKRRNDIKLFSCGNHERDHYGDVLCRFCRQFQPRRQRLLIAVAVAIDVGDVGDGWWWWVMGDGDNIFFILQHTVPPMLSKQSPSSSSSAFSLSATTWGIYLKPYTSHPIFWSKKQKKIKYHHVTTPTTEQPTTITTTTTSPASFLLPTRFTPFFFAQFFRTFFFFFWIFFAAHINFLLSFTFTARTSSSGCSCGVAIPHRETQPKSYVNFSQEKTVNNQRAYNWFTYSLIYGGG